MQKVEGSSPFSRFRVAWSDWPKRAGAHDAPQGGRDPAGDDGERANNTRRSDSLR
jgi:hypothetical protein